ncbi:hypothetical protein MMC25_006296 [Agyrium rufum]|nr:hypothetical protein [Agyrium rufum]
MSDIADCCKSGFLWDAEPKGKVSKLADLDCYVSGSNKDAAVLIVHDIFGWTLTNTRVLADHYATEANVTVYLPDFFHGGVITPEMMDDPVKRDAFDGKTFMLTNNKAARYPEVLACASALRTEHEYNTIGTIGFCYGGYGALKLATEKQKDFPSLPLVDCAAIAHPSLIDNSEFDGVAAPLLIIAPEVDKQFPMEFKEHALKTLPTLGVDYAFIYFKGLEHGFATRGDRTDEVQRKGLERAKDDAVHWFKRYLH